MKLSDILQDLKDRFTQHPEHKFEEIARDKEYDWEGKKVLVIVYMCKSCGKIKKVRIKS